LGPLATAVRTAYDSPSDLHVDAAYLLLRMRAAETGTTLADSAAAVLAELDW
jgi:hypothetical protein